MCTLYQNNASFTDLLLESGLCLIMGYCIPYKAGVSCMYRGMAITHRHRLQIKDTVFL